MDLLAKYAREWLGLELSAEQLERFQLYYNELVRRNEQINLTSITEYEAVQIRHFLDSLTLASARLRGDPPDQPFEIASGALIDIGAGAGFPGLALKILYPEMGLTLVESVGKKAAFLSEVAVKLGFQDVRVLTERAEEVGQMPEHREQYAMATGRAVAALGVLAEYCLPLVKVGGLFVAPKKGELAAEIEAAQKAITILGGKRHGSPEFQLPSEQEKRQLIVIEKFSQTPQKYPRRTGIPAKRPIA